MFMPGNWDEQGYSVLTDGGCEGGEQGVKKGRFRKVLELLIIVEFLKIWSLLQKQSMHIIIKIVENKEKQEKNS